MEITISVIGLPGLTARLTDVTSPAILEPPMMRAQELIRERMADYPPPPENSTYVRTGDLGRSWGAQSPIGGVEGLLGVISSTDVDYAAYVEHDPSLGDPSQAAIHRDRWQTDLLVLEQSAAEIGQDFTAAIQAALNV